MPKSPQSLARPVGTSWLPPKTQPMPTGLSESVTVTPIANSRNRLVAAAISPANSARQSSKLRALSGPHETARHSALTSSPIWLSSTPTPNWCSPSTSARPIEYDEVLPVRCDEESIQSASNWNGRHRGFACDQLAAPYADLDVFASSSAEFPVSPPDKATSRERSFENRSQYVFHILHPGGERVFLLHQSQSSIGKIIPYSRVKVSIYDLSREFLRILPNQNRASLSNSHSLCCHRSNDARNPMAQARHDFPFGSRSVTKWGNRQPESFK